MSTVGGPHNNGWTMARVRKGQLKIDSRCQKMLENFLLVNLASPTKHRNVFKANILVRMVVAIARIAIHKSLYHLLVSVFGNKKELGYDAGGSA